MRVKCQPSHVNGKPALINNAVIVNSILNILNFCDTEVVNFICMLLFRKVLISSKTFFEREDETIL